MIAVEAQTPPVEHIQAIDPAIAAAIWRDVCPPGIEGCFEDESRVWFDQDRFDFSSFCRNTYRHLDTNECEEVVIAQGLEKMDETFVAIPGVEFSGKNQKLVTKGLKNAAIVREPLVVIDYGDPEPLPELSQDCLKEGETLPEGVVSFCRVELVERKEMDDWVWTIFFEKPKALDVAGFSTEAAERWDVSETLIEGSMKGRSRAVLDEAGNVVLKLSNDQELKIDYESFISLYAKHYDLGSLQTVFDTPEVSWWGEKASWLLGAAAGGVAVMGALLNWAEKKRAIRKHVPSITQREIEWLNERVDSKVTRQDRLRRQVRNNEPLVIDSRKTVNEIIEAASKLGKQVVTNFDHGGVKHAFLDRVDGMWIEKKTSQQVDARQMSRFEYPKDTIYIFKADSESSIDVDHLIKHAKERNGANVIVYVDKKGRFKNVEEYQAGRSRVSNGGSWQTEATDVEGVRVFRKYGRQ
jgi:hypothetical protein